MHAQYFSWIAEEKALEIAFDSKRLRRICEQEWVAREELGDAMAELLMHRLADVHAALSVADVPVGSPRFTMWNEREVMLIELDQASHLVLAPNHRNNPVTNDGALDWTKVRRLKVLHIGDWRA